MQTRLTKCKKLDTNQHSTDSHEASVQVLLHTSVHFCPFIFHIVSLHAKQKMWISLHQNCAFFPVLIVKTTNDVC